MDPNESREDVVEETLRHSREVDAILAEGGPEAEKRAIEKHNAHVEAEFKRAEAGETINLTALMCGAESIRERRTK